mmetsp:Transcript_170466/g.546639  ORF Transcript_170466/g.546639 Transcript_170466/m.546639 type:complete len:304 (+) Transcript_170466:620-1531(+)
MRSQGLRPLLHFPAVLLQTPTLSGGCSSIDCGGGPQATVCQRRRWGRERFPAERLELPSGVRHSNLLRGNPQQVGDHGALRRRRQAAEAGAAGEGLGGLHVKDAALHDVLPQDQQEGQGCGVVGSAHVALQTRQGSVPTSSDPQGGVGHFGQEAVSASEGHRTLPAQQGRRQPLLLQGQRRREPGIQPAAALHVSEAPRGPVHREARRVPGLEGRHPARGAPVGGDGLDVPTSKRHQEQRIGSGDLAARVGSGGTPHHQNSSLLVLHTDSPIREGPDLRVRVVARPQEAARRHQREAAAAQAH